MEVEEDIPCLSAHSLAALREFYTEQTLNIKETGEGNGNEEIVEEDWQLSQFWYDDNTANVLAEEIISCIGVDGHVACLSCPTLFQKLKAKKSCDDKWTAVLFEFDRRFESKYGQDFVFFDYNHPLDFPIESKHKFDVIVADPPFLSEDCFTKTVESIRYLAVPSSKVKILVCTGQVMEDLATELLGVKLCKFQPSHRNNLANEFCCFANFDTRYL